MDGLLVIDKPIGPTSHDVVARVRRVLGEKRIGHTGTLDPMASGVLPLLVGRATRLAQFFDADDKRYEATVRLGVSTDTGDAVGRPTGPAYDGPLPTREAIEAVLDRFRGTFLQQPPAFSAKRIDGRRSHRLARARARAGERAAAVESLDDAAPAAPIAAVVLPAPVPVTVHSLEIADVQGALVGLHISCGGGFYVRSLAQDLGDALGTGAHLAALRRTRACGARLEHAVPLEVLESPDGGKDRAAAALVPIHNVLPELTAVALTSNGASRAGRGCELGPADVAGQFPTFNAITAVHFRLLDQEGDLLAIARGRGNGLLHPVVVLV